MLLSPSKRYQSSSNNNNDGGVSTKNNKSSSSSDDPDPSPLNLSAESGIDNAERASSVDSMLSKVRLRRKKAILTSHKSVKAVIGPPTPFPFVRRTLRT